MKKMLAVFVVAMLLVGGLLVVGTKANREAAVTFSYLADSPWPKFHANVNNTGLGTSTSNNIGALLWKFQIGNNVGSPAIGADGTIYVPSNDGYLYAINSNGTLKWKANVGATTEAPAISSDGTIYVSTGKVYALTPEGSIRWTYATDGSPSAPAIDSNGIIYVGTDYCSLYAINPNGTLRWKRFLVNPGANADISTCPAISPDGVIYIGTPDSSEALGHVFAVDSNGNIVWEVSTSGAVTGAPVIGYNGTIYVGSWDLSGPGGFMAINPDGTVKWDLGKNSFQRVFSSPLLNSNSGIDKIYFINSTGTHFLCYADENGNNGTIFEGDFSGDSLALGRDGTIFVGGSNGYLYAIKTDGTLRWKFKTGSSEYISSSPAIGSDGTVYFGSSDGYLYAVGDTRIRINNNTDFAEKALKYGWKGNGTENNPYLIENRTITVHNTVDANMEAIYIGNTTVHFIIENCTLKEARSGINLNNVVNGTIKNNAIWDCGNGIYLYSSDSNFLLNNTISNSDYGVRVYGSDYNLIYINNISSSKYDGMYLYSAYENNITHNKISLNSFGVEILEPSQRNIFKDNIFYKNNNYGAVVRNNNPFGSTATENTITNNSFLYNNGAGETYNSTSIQARDEVGGNYWDADGFGNYWLDWAKNNETNDLNGDGIVDWPYKISGSGKDSYPLSNSHVPMVLVKKGWNLISIYWQKDDVSIEKALSDIGWNRAMCYINGQWFTYNKNRAGKYNIGFPKINDEIGIWVYSSEESFVSGEIENPNTTNISLDKGWNLVGYPSGTRKNVTAALEGIPYEYVQTANETGDIVALSGTDMMEPGKAYWIYVTSDCVWTVEW